MKPNNVVITAIICLAALEIYALSQGRNGMLLTTIIAIIAGLAGWRIPNGN